MATSFGSRFLVVNGVPDTGDVPPVSSLLEIISGAYTTTRTHNNASILLFWDRHLRRLAESARILAEFRPDLFGSGHPWYNPITAPSAIQALIHDSLRVGVDLALSERDRTGFRDELAVTALFRGREDGKEELDLYLHLRFYVPPVFGAGGAHLGVAGPGREVAAAKYSDWTRAREGMEKMRPPLGTELLLSNDGDRILAGSITNFFVICRRVALRGFTFND